MTDQNRVTAWGRPPPHRVKRTSKYDAIIQQVKDRYDSGDKESWGVIGSYKNRNSANSTAVTTRKQYPEFEFRISESPTGTEEWVVWAHWKGPDG